MEQTPTQAPAMRRITAWFDPYELSVETITETVSAVGGVVVTGEARYSVKNGMNRDSLEMMPELMAPPHRWPLIEMPMHDDSLNCIAVAVRLPARGAFKFRAAMRDLERQGSGGIWEDVSDELGLPLIVGVAPCLAADGQTQ